MSFVKDETWASDYREDAMGGVGSSSLLPASTRRNTLARDIWYRTAATWFNLSARIVGLTPRSIRLRLLLGPVIGPMVAYVILTGFDDLHAPTWMFAIIVAATLLGLLMTVVVVRQALKPLGDIADAANRLGIGSSVELLPEYGSCGASIAAIAFNRMSVRINKQVEERIRLLTAFSHDMQTPITRMRLRVELAEEFPEREKLLKDLSEAERLVRDGIAYARNSHLTRESDSSVDLRAFIESIVFDYQDTGRDVSVVGAIQGAKTVKPSALRRIMSNFIDNALKFGGAAQVCVLQSPLGGTSISVMDRGPGIATDQLEAVMRPFVRLQQRSAEQAPGVGLGLAIAQQLAHEMNASIVLQNREGGGLCAQIVFPPAGAPVRGALYSTVQ